jgi:hypothetical protein
MVTTGLSVEPSLSSVQKTKPVHYTSRQTLKYHVLMGGYKHNFKGTIVTQTHDCGQPPLNIMVNIHHASPLQKLMHVLRILSVRSTKQGENDKE